jgi:hypothetical protein
VKLALRCGEIALRWRRGFLTSLVLGAATLLVGAAMLALVASSAAALSTTGRPPSAICPGVSGSSGCCGPPVEQPLAASVCCPAQTTGCCTTGCCTPITAPSDCCVASACEAALSIGATPDPAIDGQAATITGTLTGGTVAAQPVVLWERLTGQTAFSEVAQTTTDSSGDFRFVRLVRTNAEWYAKAGLVASSTVLEPVLAAVTLHPSSVRPAAGAKVTLSGSIAPSHAGERVALERLRGRRWVTIARPKLGKRSRFSVTQRLGAHAVERLRVVLEADARNARSVSAVIKIVAS